MNFDIQKSLQIIKEFKPLETTSFDGKEDALNYICYNLYNRSCEAIKSFVILFENKRYYDAFIIAGHCLETCAILSYIKDNSTPELYRERYNKYLASATLDRLKYNLALSENLETELAWANFVGLLKTFYPVGMTIIRSNKNHEEAIEKLKYRAGINKDKIKILKEYYHKIKIEDYIKMLIEKTSYFGGEEFNRFYKKYCDIKHSNMMTPGASFEHNIFEDFAEDGIMLILGIMCYLKKFKF